MTDDPRYTSNDPYIAAAPWFFLAAISWPAALALAWADLGGARREP